MDNKHYITTKIKYKHLSDKAIESIILEYNAFMNSIRSEFRSTHSNHHLNIPKRNIGKTAFMRNLANQYGTSLSNIYRIINQGSITVINGFKEVKEVSAYTVIQKRNSRKPSNNQKVIKALPFINLVIKEIKNSKFNSIDETIHDFILNRADEIDGMSTICTKTMYNYIHAGLIDLKPIDLPRMVRRKTKKNYKTYTVKNQRGTSIEERPFDLTDRSEFGHWEGDLVTGPRDGINGAFLTLIERKTRFYYMIPIKSKKSKNVYMAINKLNKLLEDNFKNIFKSITFDNGSEFSRYKDIEKKPGTKEIRTKVYFAHPYCSFERGSNEIANQLIRYYIPKGTDINTLDKAFIRMIQVGINNKKRKIHGYQSSESLFKNTIKELFDLELTKLYPDL